MRRFFLLAVISTISLLTRLQAREYVISPIEITIKIEQNKIRVQLNCSSDPWLYEILEVPIDKPLPAFQWPQPYPEKAQRYVEKSFLLKMDGQPLPIGAFDGRFIQEPLQPNSSRIVLDIEYPIGKVGTRLSGRSQFFSEIRQHHHHHHHHEEGEESDEKNFRTLLEVVGKKKLAIELPFDHPEFDIPTDDLIYTDHQKRLERINRFAFRSMSSPFFWIFLVVLFFQIRKHFFRKEAE